MKLLRPLLLLAGVLTVPLVSGCGNACLQLADQICNCQPDDTTRANCQQRARDQEGIFSVRSEDQRACQAILDNGQCTCQSLVTPEGRAACGLSFPLDAGTP